jgi:hypothetical protein
MRKDLKKEKATARGTIHVAEHETKPCRLETLGEQVSKILGVSSVETNHVTHSLSIEYDPQKVTLVQIRNKIKHS